MPSEKQSLFDKRDAKYKITEGRERRAAEAEAREKKSGKSNKDKED